MDEPLSNLDAKLRVHMRAKIAQLHRRLAATFIYVTRARADEPQAVLDDMTRDVQALLPQTEG